MRHRINFKSKELFEFKYKRNPKQWTIEQVHDLYNRALERHSKRHKLLIDLTNRIANEIQEFKKGERKVYYTKDGRIFERSFTFYREHNSWGTSVSRMENFTTEKTEYNRNQKLEFILSNEKQFEFGEEYQSLQGNTKYLHHLIKDILSDMVEDKLREVYKGRTSPEILTIDINGQKWYVKADPQHRYNVDYKKFDLVDISDELITLK